MALRALGQNLSKFGFQTGKLLANVTLKACYIGKGQMSLNLKLGVKINHNLIQQLRMPGRRMGLIL